MYSFSYVLPMCYAGSSPTRSLSKRPVSATEPGVLSAVSESPPSKVSVLTTCFVCDMYVHKWIWWHTCLCILFKKYVKMLFSFLVYVMPNVNTHIMYFVTLYLQF
jgi:hypothetical protein